MFAEKDTPHPILPKSEHSPRETVILSRARVNVCNRADDETLERLLGRAGSAIGRLAAKDVVRRIATANPDSLWVFSRQGSELAEGFQALLMLNEEGRRALIEGRLHFLDPPADMLVAQWERPALIYVWASYTPGLLAAGLESVFEHLKSPRYAAVDIVARAYTAAGARSMERFGFQPNPSMPAGFLIMPRSPTTAAAFRPRYDTYDSALVPSGITVVREASDFQKVAAIRAAVFIGEQACPYGEEFDGNDFAATHLLAYVAGEPAGCMRVRFFGDYAKLERLAVLRRFRTSRVARDLVRASVELCRTKGFRRLYGHAREDLVRFWKSFGFSVMPDRSPFPFSDYMFLEMHHELVPANDGLKLEDGPYRAIRPEGRWHEPGVLEASATRAVRNGRSSR